MPTNRGDPRRRPRGPSRLEEGRGERSGHRIGRPLPGLALLWLLGASLPKPACAQEAPPHTYAPVVMYLASPEEGARFFSLVRLLPRDHPVAIGHDFPTLQTIHPVEVDVLVHLGEQVGLGLRPTLERHKRPTIAWPYYPQFRLPPLSAIREATVERRPAPESPVPGLVAAAFVDRATVAVLIDTRDLSLEDRGMQRATTSGTDFTRARFERGLRAIAADVPAEGAVIVVFRDGG